VTIEANERLKSRGLKRGSVEEELEIDEYSIVSLIGL
jgi:hypothetical protein